MIWLTTEKAADYLGMTRSSIYCLTHQGKIPYYKMGKGRIRFSQEDLDEWMKAGRVKTTAETEAEADKVLSKMKQRAV